MEAWANPAAFTDYTNGRIFIFYVLNEGEHKGLNAQRMTRVFYRYSDDEGLTWSKRNEITAVLNTEPTGRHHVDINGDPIKNEDRSEESREGKECVRPSRAMRSPHT